MSTKPQMYCVFHMQSINRSECPRELQSTDRNIPVNVNLVKRINEDWQVSQGHFSSPSIAGKPTLW